MSEDKKTQASETTAEATNEESGNKVFTQEEVNQITAKRAKEAEERANKKFEQELAEKLAEQERLAKLSQEEREKELLEQQKKENEKITKELAMRENRLIAYEEFTKRKLPTDLVDYVVKDNVDNTKDAVEKFEASFRESVQSTIEERMKGETPKGVKTEEVEVPELRASI